MKAITLGLVTLLMLAAGTVGRPAVGASPNMDGVLTPTAAGLVTPTAAGRLTPTAAGTPGPVGAPEWWFDTWHVPQLWADGADGRGITVAVLDTGVQASLPEFTGQVLPGADFSGAGTGGGSDLDSDAFSHGTAMASLIVARPSSTGFLGTAPGAKILPEVVPLAGEQTAATPPGHATATAIRYAADHGAKVINMSFGGSRSAARETLPCPVDVQDAVVYALDKGALLVAAGGNAGDMGSPVVQPGVCLGVVSVGSVGPDLQVSDFSSQHRYLTLTSAGSMIATLSRSGRLYVGFGSSQASALASAAIALVWSKYPSETNAQILSRVISTARDLGPTGHDSAYGYGFIDPYAAITGRSDSASVNPVFTGVEPLRALARNPVEAPVALPAAGAGTNPATAVLPAAPRERFDGVFWALAAAAAILAVAAAGFLVLAARSTVLEPDANQLAGGSQSA